MLRLDWSLSRLVTQDIKTQPQINHSFLLFTAVNLVCVIWGWSGCSVFPGDVVPDVYRCYRLCDLIKGMKHKAATTIIRH